MNNDTFNKVIQLFDEANAQDPNTEMVNGKAWPKELIYSKRMSECLNKFEPKASTELKLAAHAQHICRWKIPRSAYPMDRKGYHQWRNELKTFHAKTAGELMDQAGYDESTIDRVAFLLQKRKLKLDDETQTLEDVICLVFLEFYFEDFAKKYDEDKIIDIVRKTLVKMSDKGKAAALKINFTSASSSIIAKALES